MKSSSYINKYEFTSLVRQRWLQLLSLILLVLVLFAVFNGDKKVDRRLADIQSAVSTVTEKDANALVLLDSLEAGFDVDLPSWSLPNQPHVVGNNYPRIASMPPSTMASIATGQSDIYTHYVQPKLYGESFELNYTELSSPVHLMFGSFDLSFVLIYLLPLIVIAFSYNILSREREQGILQIVASHPISINRWLLQKGLVRYSLLSGILTILLLGFLALADPSIFEDFSSLLTFILLTLAYALFWFVLVCLLNLRGQSSANNAVWLIASWILLVLLLPSTVSQMANTLYPVPSRTTLVNETRVVTVEADKKADELLESYLRDHPELAGYEEGSTPWKEYFATQDLIRKEIQPVLNEYESKLLQQQDWVTQLRFISPALLLQSSYNEISGTSTRHYEDYRRQVSNFSSIWRDYFVPKIFKGEKFTKAMMLDLPEFDYKPLSSFTLSATNLLVLLIYSLALLLLGLGWSKRFKTKLLST